MVENVLQLAKRRVFLPVIRLVKYGYQMVIGVDIPLRDDCGIEF